MSSPSDFAEDRPNVARMYDYMLCGAHNFGPDRQQVEHLLETVPDARAMAWANRDFLRHAVEFAADRGIDQFLDLGSGIPTVGNVHEIAHRHDPDARVAYVDYEPVAVAHAQTLLADIGQATMTDADLCDVSAVLGAPGVAGLLDFTRPVALLAVAALHFVRDSQVLRDVLAGYRSHLAPGSILALTHVSSDYPEFPEMMETRRRVNSVYAETTNPSYDRSRAEILDLVRSAGFAARDDALIDVSNYADGLTRSTPLSVYSLITEPVE